MLTNEKQEERNAMIRVCKTDGYNWIFDTQNGNFARWGKTKEDDPTHSPVGPEILDIEVSTVCSGPTGIPCSHCYKSNTPNGQNMPLEMFKEILDKMPKNLTQIAFGIGDIDANPDLLKMFEYCRSKNIIPNVTINGSRMTPGWYDRLAELCGAVAVSRYPTYWICYNAVKELTSRGMKQVNIHMMTSKETYLDCFQLIDAKMRDERLKDLNAIVFLLMKPKGNRNKHTQLTNLEDYGKLIKYALDRDVAIGFDSCSAPYVVECLKDHPNFDEIQMSCEPCESGCFSSYINTKGEYWHCSFTEDHTDWRAVNVLQCKDFLSEIWFSQEVVKFREKIIAGGKWHECPVYNLSMK